MGRMEKELTEAPLERDGCISSRRGFIQLLQPLKLRERLEQLKTRARGEDGARRRRRP